MYTKYYLNDKEINQLLLDKPDLLSVPLNISHIDSNYIYFKDIDDIIELRLSPSDGLLSPVCVHNKETNINELSAQTGWNINHIYLNDRDEHD